MTDWLGTRWAAVAVAVVLAWCPTARAADGAADGDGPDGRPQAGVMAAAAAVGPTGPASLGQQPLPTEQPADHTPSQANNTQFNQLFQFEATPDICAAGEGYLSGQATYSDFGGSDREIRGQLQGQYGVTDQIAVGSFIPVVYNHRPQGHADVSQTDVGDVGLYGQYKFDRLINPEIVDVTAQVDMILPTGNATQRRDTGKFGVRPLALAYKDFGRQGPGTLGVYGLVGFTITSNSDFRLGLAATYEVRRLAAVIEFVDVTGTKAGKPQVTLTPGLVYRGIRQLEIAAGVPVGLNTGSPNFGVALKVTYAFQN